MSPSTQPSRWGPGHPLGRALRIALAGAALVAAVVTKLPLCPFAIVTRHPCPGCGLTRATLALAHGDLHGALGFHPLAPVVAPIVVVALVYNAVGYVRDGRWAAAERVQGRWVDRFGVALAVAMIVVWVARFLGAFGGPVPV